MKGLWNNEEAIKVLNKLKGSLDNRLHQLYNLGYKQGFRDGASEVMEKLAEQILNERRGDEADR